MDYLHDKFFDIVKRYFEKSDCEKAHQVTDKIIKSYNEPHRKYHTLEHIAKCLDVTNLLFKLDVVQINNIRMAIIYHDIIYNPIAKDNEELSELAFIYDIPYGWRSDAGKLIREMILATKHTNDYLDGRWSTRQYQEYICDVDLHQLGCGLNEFLYNESLIREEYKMIPDEVFYPNRSKILQRILDNHIYYSTIFKTKFGYESSRNLKYVLDRQTMFSVD